MSEKRIKVLLSTNGPVKFIKTAEYVSKYVDITVVQGFIPGKFSKRFLIPILSKMVGRDLSKSFDKRTPKALDGRNYSIPIGELYGELCRFLHRILKIRFNHLASRCLSLYGKASKRKIKNGYDIFHVRSGSGQGGAIEKAHKLGIKVLVHHTIANPVYLEEQRFEEYNPDLWNAVYDDCLKADALLVNSDFVKETFVSKGWCGDKINVVYSGVAAEFIGLKRDYNIRGRVNIIFTGGFVSRKGCEYIIAALEQLNEDSFEYEFHAYGSYSEQLLKVLPSNCYCDGPIAKEILKTKLAEADIFLFPSLAEGCSASAMEALAAGLPCILTMESGTPARDNKEAIIVPTRDPQSIVASIKRLSSSIELRQRLGKSAIELSKQYSWEKHAQNVYNVYKKMLES